MKSAMMIGVAGALLTGVFIGTQAAIGSRIGTLIGPIRTGLLMNVLGGSIALLLLGITFFFPIKEDGIISTQSLGWLAFAGLLGILIITGVSFSLQRVGVTAGIGSLLFGQLVVSTIVDTFGIGGADPIPFSPKRIVGLVVMLVAVYLLLPKD
jgi:bacterial/archaeal transporter family-2 protein